MHRKRNYPAFYDIFFLLKKESPVKHQGMKEQIQKSEQHKIGLLLPKNYSWTRRVLPGLAAYARENTQWELCICMDPDSKEALQRYDALLGTFYEGKSPTAFPWIVERALPCVNISGAQPPENIPLVTHDNIEIGRRAAQHLMDLGLEHFACVGIEHLEHTFDRRRGFHDAVVEAGFEPPQVIEENESKMRLERMLSRRAFPMGIFAVNDQRARHVEHYIHTKTPWKIPGEIALIGCDNDFMECELCSVPISSIELDYELLGRTAGELLHRMIQGESVPDRNLIQPLEVVQRRSSDYLLIDDSMVRRVLYQLRIRYSEHLSTADLARQQGLTPRHLQRRFKAATGKKLQEALLEIRLQKAAALLRDTPKTISEIAMDTGFSDLNRFPSYFRRQFGATPRAYRNQLPKH